MLIDFFSSTLQSFKVLWEISTPFHLLFVIINRPTIQKTILFGFPLELFYKAPFRVLVFWVGAPVCWSEMKNALLFPFFPAFSTLTDLMLLKHYCFSPATIHLSIQSFLSILIHAFRELLHKEMSNFLLHESFLWSSLYSVRHVYSTTNKMFWMQQITVTKADAQGGTVSVQNY